MKNGSSNQNDKRQLEFKFTFGPFLHEQCAELWPVEKMLYAAKVYEQAAHQLRVIALALQNRRSPSFSKPRLKKLPIQKLRLN